MASVDGLVRAVAAYKLPGTPARLSAQPLPQEVWDPMVANVRRERLTGLLARAVSDGALSTTPHQSKQAASLRHATMCVLLTLEGSLLEVVELLLHSGIDYRVLKGSSVAHLDYPEPAWRPYVDVDLLVRPEHFDRTVAVLAAAGHVRRYPQLNEGFDRRFGKGATFLAPSGLEVDLHRTLDRGPFGLTVDLDDLWVHSAPFDLGGREVTALGPEHRFLSVCFHAALGNVPARLAPLRDVAQMLLTGDLDIDRVRSSAARWRAEIVVARAVMLAWDAFDLTRDVELSLWARSYRRTPRDRRALRLYLDLRQSHLRRTLATVPFVSGTWNKLAYLRGMIVPSSSYLNARNHNYFTHWRRARDPWRHLRQGGTEPPRHQDAGVKDEA